MNRLCNLCLFRRQIDIAMFKLLCFLPDTSLCIFGDDLQSYILNTNFCKLQFWKMHKPRIQFLHELIMKLFFSKRFFMSTHQNSPKIITSHKMSIYIVICLKFSSIREQRKPDCASSVLGILLAFDRRGTQAT